MLISFFCVLGCGHLGGPTKLTVVLDREVTFNSPQEIVSASKNRLLLTYTTKGKKYFQTSDWHRLLGKAIHFQWEFSEQYLSRDGKLIGGDRFYAEPMRPNSPLVDLGKFIYFDGSSKNLITPKDLKDLYPISINEIGLNGKSLNNQINLPSTRPQIAENSDFFPFSYWVDKNHIVYTYYKAYGNTDTPYRHVSYVYKNNSWTQIQNISESNGFVAHLPFGDWLYGIDDNGKPARANLSKSELLQPATIPSGETPELLQVSENWILFRIPNMTDTDSNYHPTFVALATTDPIVSTTIHLNIPKTESIRGIFAVPFTDSFITVTENEKRTKSTAKLWHISK